MTLIFAGNIGKKMSVCIQCAILSVVLLRKILGKMSAQITPTRKKF